MQGCINLHRGWEVKIWNDTNILGLDINHNMYDNLPGHDSRKDYIELIVLKTIGGIFLDVDVTCLKPLDELAYRYSFFASLEPPSGLFQIVPTTVAIMGSSPGNDIIVEIHKLFVKYFANQQYRIYVNSYGEVHDRFIKWAVSGINA